MNGIGKAAIFLVLFLWAPPFPAFAERIIVFDAATGVHSSVFIRVQTRGTLFSAGGLLAEIEVEGTTAGTVLTGADGFGYLKFTPTRSGLLTVTARLGDRAGRGRLLSVLPSEPVLVVEIDGPVRSLPKLTTTVEHAADSLRALSGAFRIIYLAGMLGPAVDRAWLASVNMPESVVLPGDGAGLLRGLKEKGMGIRAV
ncbi:MAG: hypothetical protein PVG78_13645, partial [Desulfobacterales bacterium]